MTSTLFLRSARSRTLRVVGVAAGLSAMLYVAGCSSFFDVKNTNLANIEDLVGNPTRTKLSAAASVRSSSSRGTIRIPGLNKFAADVEPAYCLNVSDALL